MNELTKFTNQMAKPETFDQIQIGLASPERIRSWSFGEIQKPETINYRTFKPERDAQAEYDEDACSAGIGAEAVKIMLMDLDLAQEKEDLLKELSETKSELKPKKIIKRLKVVESFIESGNKPEWMILDVVPVIPP